MAKIANYLTCESLYFWFALHTKAIVNATS